MPSSEIFPGKRSAPYQVLELEHHGQVNFLQHQWDLLGWWTARPKCWTPSSKQELHRKKVSHKFLISLLYFRKPRTSNLPWTYPTYFLETTKHLFLQRASVWLNCRIPPGVGPTSPGMSHTCILGFSSTSSGGAHSWCLQLKYWTATQNTNMH